MSVRPDMRRGDGDPVPFPVTTKAKAYAGRFSRAAFNAAVDETPVTSTPIAGLVATQPTVDPAEVARFTEHKPDVEPGKRSRQGLLIDHPVIASVDGARYIHDGHHRITAAKARGDTTVDARVVVLGKSSGSGLARWAGAS